MTFEKKFLASLGITLICLLNHVNPHMNTNPSFVSYFVDKTKSQESEINILLEAECELSEINKVLQIGS